MPDENSISSIEAIQMMERCKADILNLRAEIARLQPRAEAYDNIAILLRLLPRQSMGMGEDVVWTLDRRIRELKAAQDKAEGTE